MRKIVLSESQMKAVLLEERLALILQESLNESKTFEDLKKKVMKALALGVSVVTLISAISHLNIDDAKKQELMNMIDTTEMPSDTTNKADFTDSTFTKKVKDVEAYMKFALKNQGFTLDSTGLKPETLVRASMETGFDLPFLMAAAHQESCFGATPRARRTNSIFSVGAFDDGRDMASYDDPNDSVMGYINLLNNHYLVNGKTIDDLMTPGNFTNEIGNRYASCPDYEKKIKSLRNLIIRKFPDLAG